MIDLPPAFTIIPAPPYDWAVQGDSWPDKEEGDDPSDDTA